MGCLALILFVAGCRDPGTSGRDALLELEEPVTDRMEPAVRDELKQALAALRSLASRPGVANEVLGRAYGDLGRHYHAYELYGSAVPCYRIARILLPADYRWSYYLGRAYRSTDDLERALASFERARELKPTDDPTLIALAQVHREQRRLDRAAELVEDVLARSPDSAGALLLMAELAQDRGDPSAAVEWYERLLRLQPAATRVHRPLAMAQRALGQTDKAKEYLETSGEGTVGIDDPLMAELQALGSGARRHVNRGITLFNRGDFAEAAAAFAEAVQADPRDIGARLNMGSALARLERFDEAIQSYREVLTLDPSHAMAHFNLGVVLEKRGDLQESLLHYEASLRIDPDYRDPLFNLASGLRRAGRCDAALGRYSRLLELDPRNASARFGEAVCLNSTGRAREAFQRLEEGLRVLPGSRPLTQVAARLLAAAPDDGIRDGNRALKLARRLVEEQRDPESLETLAMALAEAGQYAEAVETQRAAITMVESSGPLHLLERLRINLDGYERGQPCRDPAVR